MLLYGRAKHEIISEINKPVSVVNFGGDLLLQLLELVLRQSPRQDLRPPLDEVADHAPHAPEHLPVVVLSGGTEKPGSARWV